MYVFYLHLFLTVGKKSIITFLIIRHFLFYFKIIFLFYFLFENYLISIFCSFCNFDLNDF